MDKLKICYIGDANSIHLKKWANEFKNRGHDVHLLTDVTPKNLDGINVHKITNRWGIKNLIKGSFNAKEKLKDINPDIVHSHFVFSYGYFGVFSRKHPHIISPWGSDIVWWPEKNFVFKFITKHVLKKTDKIHCADIPMENRVKELIKGSNKIFRNGWGIDTELFKPNMGRPGNESINILYFRISETAYKTDILINAMPEVIQHNKNVKFIILNSGKELDKTKKKIGELGLTDYVQYQDKVPYTKMPALLNSSDIYVDTAYSEVPGCGIGLTAFEAMSCQLPIIMTNTAGIEYYVKHNDTGIVYEGENSESLSQAIIQLVDNAELRKTIGQNARNFVLKEENWKLNMDKMENFYRSIVKGGVL